MPFEDMIAAPDAVRSYTFDRLRIGCDKPLTLQCKHAGFSNAGLSAAQLKSFNDRRLRGNNSNNLTTQAVEADRVLDAQQFSKYVVVGWDAIDAEGKQIVGETTVYEDGKPVPFSTNKCQELLLAISKKRLDEFRRFTNWASDADKFTEAAVGDPAELGK